MRKKRGGGGKRGGGDGKRKGVEKREKWNEQKKKRGEKKKQGEEEQGDLWGLEEGVRSSGGGIELPCPPSVWSTES